MTTTLGYTEFLARKQILTASVGFAVAPENINPTLHDWQRDIVRWALFQGRAALFQECGLGKTFQQLEWAKHVAAYTLGKVLVVAPLAVAQQTIREGQKLGIGVVYCRSQDEASAAAERVIITNYDMVGAFNADEFAGVVLDESSILKSFSGAMKRHLLDMFKATPYRLACTATPAPNDHLELGNHAEFLGVMPSHEMIMRFFLNDSMKAGGYRLKKHAESDFWTWVTSWAVCISKPSDLGTYADAGYDLPPLIIQEHLVEVDYADAQRLGRLFPDDKPNATAMWKEKRQTVQQRCLKAAELVNAAPEESWIVWCDTNDEADLLIKLLPSSVEVRGSQSLKVKEAGLTAFSDGVARIIITKPDIAGFGLNWQHCGRQVFVGVTYSFEKTYQALRRSLRYGRVGPVEAHLIYAESEGNILATLREKQEQHRVMQEAMRQSMAEYGLFRADARLELQLPESDVDEGNGWTIYNGDCVAVSRILPGESVDFSIFSPPFSNLYCYSDSIADMGNCQDHSEFFQHFEFLIAELHRITRAGRLCAVHCKDLPLYQNRDGAAGLYDFPGALVRAFEAHGWTFHSRVTIWKDPVIEASRTNSHGLLFRNFSDRAEVVRQGMADYVLVFRKHIPDMPVQQVQNSPKPPAATLSGERYVTGEDGEGNLQTTQARVSHKAHSDYIGEQPPTSWKNDRDYAIQVWQRYASPVWFDIDQARVLNYQIARENEDEKHICPLQLDVIARCVDLWTNKGDVVFSPFAGIGSEGHEALRLGRKFIGVELKRAYWEHARRNLERMAFQQQQPTLFDLDEVA